MTAFPNTDEFSCPRCGVVLQGKFGETVATTFEDQIRTEVECPACDAPLEIVIESALPDALGVDIWIEGRHEEGFYTQEFGAIGPTVRE